MGPAGKPPEHQRRQKVVPPRSAGNSWRTQRSRVPGNWGTSTVTVHAIEELCSWEPKASICYLRSRSISRRYRKIGSYWSRLSDRETWRMRCYEMSPRGVWAEVRAARARPHRVRRMSRVLSASCSASYVGPVFRARLVHTQFGLEIVPRNLFQLIFYFKY